MNTLHSQQTNMKRTFRLIHSALMIGMTLFSIVTIFITSEVQYLSFEPDEKSSVFYYLIPAVVLLSIVLSEIVYRRTKTSDLSKDAHQALSNLLTRHITRIAPLEGAGLFTIVAFLLTGNFLFLCFTGLLLARFIALFPTNTRIDNWMGTSHQRNAGRYMN